MAKNTLFRKVMTGGKLLAFATLAIAAASTFPFDNARTANATAFAPTFIRIPTIQLLGDSLTSGTGSSTIAGFREPLYNLGAVSGVQTFRFVGSATTNPAGLALIDPNHEGHSGYVLRSGTGFPSITDTTVSQFYPYTPDVWSLLCGTNDIDPAVNNDSAATLATSLGTELDTIAAKFSKSWQQIIVWSLIKRLDATDTKVQAYNALIDGVIATKTYKARVWHGTGSYDAVRRQVIGQGYNDAVHLLDEGYTDEANAMFADPAWKSALAAAQARLPTP